MKTDPTRAFPHHALVDVASGSASYLRVQTGILYVKPSLGSTLGLYSMLGEKLTKNNSLDWTLPTEGRELACLEAQRFAGDERDRCPMQEVLVVIRQFVF